MRRASGVSLLGKILLSTSVAITLLFGITGWAVQQHVEQSMAQMLQEEVSAGFQVYESLWKSRERTLASVSRVLSSMSDVRAAFSTGDPATIKDTAGDVWARIADAEVLFVVTDADGRVIATRSGENQAVPPVLPFVPGVRARFPEQASGFVFLNDMLYQVTVTPVYVQSGVDPVLINVVVAGYRVGPSMADQLKRASGGSEFLFRSGSRLLASTVPAADSRRVWDAINSGHTPEHFAPLRSELRDLSERPIAELWILRSFAGANERIATLRRDIFLIYLLALTAGLVLTTVLARKIVEPIKELDRAASEVARQNYDHRVTVRGSDEIGRLGATFNTMLGSLGRAREDLIRQERISTIGQLSTSIVHDLRNPLAAIYGGAEMLIDSELPASQVQRLARNIYRASRNIQDLLQQLADASVGKRDRTEVCKLRDVVAGALEPVRALAETSNVAVSIDIPEDIEVPLARARMERVFANLLVNAVEAMKGGGSINITGKRQDNVVYVDIADTGPGIPAGIRPRLFQPFVSEGKKNGLGLGLALSRQTVLNQGGDMWLQEEPGSGARFRMKLAL